MDSRVGGTVVGQMWRITGFTASDRQHLVGSETALVGLEFWMESSHDDIPRAYKYLVPNTLDPALARELGQHLIDMANHAEGLV